MSMDNATTTTSSTTTEATTTSEALTECKITTYWPFYADEFTCFIYKLPFILYDADFGYIAAGLSLLIILISLFGRIKLHYRWFILNMAFIDLLNTYDFICIAPTLYAPVLDNAIHKCPIYMMLPLSHPYFIDLIPHLPPIGVFILALSRFISVYFPKFYKKYAKTWTVIFFVIFINLIYTVVLLFLFKNRYDSNQEIYFKVLYYIKNKMEDEIKKAANAKFLLLIGYASIPAIILLFSILLFALLVFKIFCQLKFQAKSNAEMFKSNIRIITVLSLQTIMLCALLPLEAMYQINQPVSPEFQPYYPYLDLPPWLYGIINENGVRCFREFRVFIDSFIILIFMKGYREDLFAAVLWTLKIFQKVWNRFSGKTVVKTKVKPINSNFTRSQNSLITTTAIQTF